MPIQLQLHVCSRTHQYTRKKIQGVVKSASFQGFVFMVCYMSLVTRARRRASTHERSHIQSMSCVLSDKGQPNSQIVREKASSTKVRNLINPVLCLLSPSTDR